jgi:hypothetical protein
MRPLHVFRWFISAAIVALSPVMVQTTAAQSMGKGHGGMRVAPNFSNGRGFGHFDHRDDFAFRHHGNDRFFFRHYGDDHFFFRHQNRFFFQQFAWPVYSYPYYDPFAYSYLDYAPDYNYQYLDDSAAPVQPESFSLVDGNSPIVIVTNKGNSRPMDSSSNTGYVNSGYGSNYAGGQQRKVMQDPNERIGPRTDPTMFVPPAVPEPTQTAKSTQTTPPEQAGMFGKLVLVGWLQDAGKDVIFVQNTETNRVQKITSEPNKNNFRIVEVHPNANPKLFEAIISNGSEQELVRCRF